VFLKEKTTGNITRDEVQTASAQIVKTIQEKGQVRLEQLARETEFESHIFEWAIGYLIHQDEIEITRDGESLMIRRKKPDTHAPVFI
jgi:hypothetical protein